MRSEYEYNTEDFESREANDAKVYVKFYVRPVLNEVKSDEEGRPIYEDRDYVEIRTPGNTTNVIQRPVSDLDRQRFRRQYESFKAGDKEQVVGTPLVEVNWMTRAQVEELAYIRVRTLEQLAEVGDDVCTRIPGLFKLKQRAGVMVEKAKTEAPILQMQTENENLRNEMDTLRKTVEAQAGEIASLKSAKK
jgi:hypothetical protein